MSSCYSASVLSLIMALTLLALPTSAAPAVDADGYYLMQTAQASDRRNRKAPAKRTDNRRDDRREDKRDDRREDNRYDRRDDRRDDRQDDRRDDRWKRYWRYRIGVSILTLPLRYNRVVIGPTVYYYSSGVYFVKRGGGYVVIGAPVGARIAMMPYGFRSMYIGPRRYFFVNSTYYIYVPTTRDYVVVARPSGIDSAVNSESRDPIVYPASGQTDEQIDQDRYECHRWSLDESGFDPSAPQSSVQAGSDRYYRSLEACLSGRGYTLG